MRAKILMIVMVGALAACASAPNIRYYTLDMEPSAQATPSVNLVVDQVRTTDALSRARIMIQASPTRIEYYAADQWVGALSELVRQKLTAEFGPPVEGRRTLVVSVLVLSAEQVDVADGAAAKMRLSVSVRDSTTKRYQPPLMEKTYEAFRAAPQATAAAVVEALSICAEEIAREIVSDTSAI